MQTLRNKVLPLAWPLRVAAAASLIWIPLAVGASAQEPAPEADRPVTAATVVPQQVRYAGKLAVRAGETVQTEFRIYAAQDGGEPLWTETQQVPIALDGSYSVLLGADSSKGLPQTVFAGGAARWLGISVDRSPEQERVLLSSVPYAMKSADAESLAGHAASDFVTQEQLAALAISAPAASPGAQPQGSGPITGVGTTGNVALFTGANTIGNSDIVQVGSDVGINVTTPATLLDVGGATTVRGQLDLPAPNLATASGGSSSPQFELGASSYSTAVPGPVAQNFVLETTATGNNTATPSALLQVLFGSGAANPTATGLSISPNGHINFASGQPFPYTGTVTGITTTAPLTGNGSSGSIALGFSTSALETTLNTVYPQLTAANTFHSSQTIDGGLTTTSGITTSGVVASGVLQAVGGFLSNNSVQMKNPNVATATTGYNSPVFEFVGSAYNSLTSAAVNQYFSWQALISGNDTSTPTANLALLAGSGSTQSPTGFSISEKGIVTFVSGQTFPGAGGGSGTITGITTTSPLTGSGTSGSVALGLNTGALLPAITPPLETTFNAIYPQLNAQNSFTNNNAFSGTVSSLGTLDLEANGVTSSFAPNLNSALLELSANAYNSTEGLPEALNFGWQSVATGGNTSSPSANLELLYGTGSAQPAATGLSIAPSGVITFASGQTFPGGGGGGGTITGVTAGAGLTGGGTTGAVSLSIPTAGIADYMLANAYPGVGTCPAGSAVTSLGRNVNPTCASFGTGTITGVTAGTGLTGGGVTGTPTLAIDTTVVPLLSGATFTGQISGATSVLGATAVMGSATNGLRLSGGGVGGVSDHGYGVWGNFTGANYTGAAGVLGFTLGAFSNTFVSEDFSYSAGVWADASGSTGNPVALIATADGATAGFFENNSAGFPTVYAVNNGTGATGLFKTFMATGSDGTCGIGSGGDLSCTGRMKALVSIGGGTRKVETYSVQSPENWMEDFGTGELQRGVAVVKIDPAFAETVSETADYHVFLTPRADSKGLYVINATPTSFEVRESGGGTSSLTFDYRIVAKRRGYEAQRLTDVTERFNAEQARAMPLKGVGAPQSPRAPRYSPGSPGKPGTSPHFSHPVGKQ